MIISKDQDYSYKDPFADKDPHVHDAFQESSHYESTASFNTGESLPHVNEDFNHFPNAQNSGLEESPLVHNAADVGRSDNYRDLGRHFHVVSQILTMTYSEYAEPYGGDKRPVPSTEKTFPARYPLEQRIEDKKRGIGRQRYPFVGALPSAQGAPCAQSQASLGLESSHGCSVYLRVGCQLTRSGYPGFFQGMLLNIIFTFPFSLTISADCQSHARSIFKRSYQCRGSISSLYEAGPGSASFITTWMYVETILSEVMNVNYALYCF